MTGGTRLVGDVGGTNVRFAVADRAGGRPRLHDPRGFEREGLPTLEAAIDRYLADWTGERPTGAVIAVAGPVSNGAADLTNGEWDMSETALRAHGFASARLINDYTALALSLRWLEGDDLALIGEALPDRSATAVIVGAGTGLGVGGMARDAAGETVIVSEGGHIAFAPTDEVEIGVLRALTGRFGRVSLERILSGPGLVNLRWALAASRGETVGDLEPEDIVAAAAERSDPLCVETLDRFCAIYGSACGDFAMAYGALGGVYLGGGIPPRILDRLRASDFRKRFEAKGRFEGYVKPIATAVILHEHAALLGAAGADLGRD